MSDYPAIRAWGRMMGSYAYYINDETERARAANAPRLAIFEREGVWRTLDGVVNPAAITYFRQNHPELAKEAWGDDK